MVGDTHSFSLAFFRVGIITIIWIIIRKLIRYCQGRGEYRVGYENRRVKTEGIDSDRDAHTASSLQLEIKVCGGLDLLHL